MFDVKKFTAFIAFNDEFRNLYYDIAESQGIESVWDVYHIQEGRESPTALEIKIMNEIFISQIKNNELLLKIYQTADSDFSKKTSKKINQYLRK